MHGGATVVGRVAFVSFFGLLHGQEGSGPGIRSCFFSFFFFLLVKMFASVQLSRPCATCRIKEKRESVHVLGGSPKISPFRPYTGLQGGGLGPPPCSLTFESAVGTLRECGLSIVVGVENGELKFYLVSELVKILFGKEQVVRTDWIRNGSCLSMHFK